MAGSLAHNPVRATRLDAFETSRPERPSGFGTVFIHTADGHTRTELKMNAVSAVKPDIGHIIFLKQAFCWQDP